MTPEVNPHTYFLTKMSKMYTGEKTAYGQMVLSMVLKSNVPWHGDKGQTLATYYPELILALCLLAQKVTNSLCPSFLNGKLITIINEIVFQF